MRRIIMILLLVGLAAGCAKKPAAPDLEEIVRRLSAYPNDVVSLRQDETLAVNEHSRIYHGELVEEFMRKAKTGELVELTTVSFTIEGAAIFTDVYFDGSAYLMVKDCSRDAWDVEAGIEIETYACCGWVRSEPPDPEASASVTLVLTDQPVESWEELRELYADSEKQYGWVFAMRENAGS